ncbi:MAG: hypothetical protein SNJ72_01010 [Fimbriimonadales bacterium]
MMKRIGVLVSAWLALVMSVSAQTTLIQFYNEQEINDSTGLATDLGVVGVSGGQRLVKIVRGLINPDNDIDWFRIQIPSTGTYTVRVDTTFDSVVSIHNSSGTLIAENDDDVPGNNNLGNRDTSFTNADSGITLTLNSGIYLVQVRSIASAGDLARLRYTLRIFDGATFRDSDPYEASGTNNTFATATNIANLADDFTLIDNAFLTYRQADLDHYRIEIGNGDLTVRTIGATDTIVTVYNSAFSPLASNDDDPHDPFNPFTSRVSLTNLPAGVYYIRVEGFAYGGGPAGGWYDVLLTDYTPVRRNLTGRVEMSHNAIQTVPFELKILQPGSNTLRQQRTFNTNPAGNFATYTSIMSGTVDLAVKAPTSLVRKIRNVSLNSDVSGLVFNLINGDLNGDNVIDDADLLIVLFAFGSNDANADLNGDGVVDDADLLIVLFNFGAVGD